MKTYAIILASGKGTRIKHSKVAKQFIEIFQKPIICYTIEAFENNENIDKIIVVCENIHFDYLNLLAKKNKYTKLKLMVEGGDTRQKSSFQGLKSIQNQAEDNDIVIIHDSARPLVSQKIIDDNLEVVKKGNIAVLTANNCTDTVYKIQDGEVVENINRETIFFAQTPQTFSYGEILRCHEKAIADNEINYTDDISIFRNYSKNKVVIVKGSKDNLKITVDDDLVFFRNKLLSID